MPQRKIPSPSEIHSCGSELPGLLSSRFRYFRKRIYTGCGRLLIVGLFLAITPEFAGADTFDDLRLMLDRGRYPDAVSAARKNLAEIKAVSRKETPALAHSYELLAEALIRNGESRNPETARFVDRALEIRVSLHGESGLKTTNALLLRGMLDKELGNIDSARQRLETVAAIREREPGSSDLDRAHALNELASVHMRQRNNDAASELFLRASEIIETSLGPDHPEMALSLLGMVEALSGAGFPGQAKPLADECIGIRKRVLGPDHPLTAQSMLSLALIERRLDNPGRAEDLTRDALDIINRSLGPDHIRSAGLLNFLGTLRRDQGDYVEARDLYQRVLGLFEKYFGPNHAYVAGTLNNLAIVYRLTGDFSSARTALERSLELREELFGRNHPLVAQSLTNLAGVLIHEDRQIEAIPLLQRALRIQEAAFGPNNLRLVNSLNDLGLALREAEDLEAASLALARATAIIETELGPHGRRIADLINNQALIAHQQGNLGEARAGFTRAHSLYLESFGVHHPKVGLMLFNLARVESDAGNPEVAFDLALRAERQGREHLQLTAAALSEREALAYAWRLKARIDLVMHLAGDCHQCSNRAWDRLIRSRGQILRELALRRHDADPGDLETLNLLARLEQSSGLLSRLTLRGPGKETNEAYRGRIEATRLEVEQLERELGASSAAISRDQQRDSLGLADVTNALAPGASLVAFSRSIAYLETIGTSMPDTFDYLALVIGSDETTPNIINLGPADEIDHLVFRWQAEASSAGSEDDYRRAGAALKRRIWDPVAELFGESPVVFVVPDGSLNLVNLAALPTEGSHYLVEDGPLIHMLSSERALVPRAPVEANDDRPQMLALGNPDFNAGRGDVTGGTTTEGLATYARWSGSPGSSVEPMFFQPLPATAVEIETVLALWREVNGDDPSTTTVLSGTQATEARFKEMAPGRQILHLATHGFVLGGPRRQSTASGRGVGGLAPADQGVSAEEGGSEEVENPFRLSGLALAGANVHSTADPSTEDGILTALEVANLDLSGVEWAVLSGCETGIGKTIAGEGVFGFRRAFRIAGARTVIMSLWPVEDAGGRDWMEQLYRSRLIDGMTTAEAVRHASLSILKNRRRKGLSTHPFFWGAFVASGDWR